ncbi:hypothetical protein PGB90_005796 [Kerria lacca]
MPTLTATTHNNSEGCATCLGTRTLINYFLNDSRISKTINFNKLLNGEYIASVLLKQK